MEKLGISWTKSSQVFLVRQMAGLRQKALFNHFLGCLV